jgi:hypothetical protein
VRVAHGGGVAWIGTAFRAIAKRFHFGADGVGPLAVPCGLCRSHCGNRVGARLPKQRRNRGDPLFIEAGAEHIGKSEYAGCGIGKRPFRLSGGAARAGAAA